MITRSHPMTPSTTTDRSAGEVLRRLWAHSGTRIAAAAGAAVTSGLTAAFVMPRGPVTSNQALLLMALGLVTGIVAGFILRSRWAMVLAPVAHIAAFELGRLGESGPTVDELHVTTTFGIIAFATGRVVYIMLFTLPLLTGVLWGMSLASLLAGEIIHHRGHGFAIRRGFSGVSAIAIAGLAVWIAMPPVVPPVLDPNGEETSGSIAELASVTLGGNTQWMEIRGASDDKPVILYIAGGPGQSDLALSRAMLQPLERDFVVVLWDQRGNGLSYASFDRESMTLDRAITDTIELTNYLRNRFNEDKIYLLGESWGSTLSVLAAQQNPELYHAVITSGQMVSQRETDRMIYADLLAWAEEHDPGLAEQLRGFGPPPYADLWAYGVVMENYGHIEGEYDPPQASVDRLDAADVGFWGIGGSEYSPINKMNLFRGLIDTFDVMYPQLQEIDFREDVPVLDVPIYIFDGEHELRGRRELVFEWFDILQAPDKQIFTFADGGHSVALEHADDLHRILMDEILPATYPDPDPDR